MNLRLIGRSFLLWSLLVPAVWFVLNQPSCQAEDFPPADHYRWGNCRYVNLSIGESFQFLGTSIKLVAVHHDVCRIEIDRREVQLKVARRRLPTIIGNVRVFAALNRPVASLTKSKDFPNVFAALTKDALICVSDASKSMLDPDRFTFPISRSDGFEWAMDENSHMFAYLSPNRAHEGVDINMHDARGKAIHRLVAIEESVVRWVTQGKPRESCVLLESASSPGVFYIYQHLLSATLRIVESRFECKNSPHWPGRLPVRGRVLGRWQCPAS